MKRVFIVVMALGFLSFSSCLQKSPEEQTYSQENEELVFPDYSDEIDGELVVDRFADLRILRYKLTGFDKLSLQQKKLVYYLSEAALAGRDIIYDQNYRHNLLLRRTLEAIWQNYQGDKEDPQWKAFEEYLKRIWFSNGIHHHYSYKKFKPKFSQEFFSSAYDALEGNYLPLEGMDKQALMDILMPVIFDENVDAKKVNKDSGIDLVKSSASNFYDPEVTEAQVDAFYADMGDPEDPRPLSYGLNSKLKLVDGELREEVWKLDGMYSESIERIAGWLDLAASVAENEAQRVSLEKLAKYYRSGDLKDFDDYSVAWVADTNSVVDVINGFIEVYNDSKGYRGSFESVVSFKDLEASERMQTLSQNVQWFEDMSPIMDEHKKEEVTGVSYKVITVAMESGDAAPATPIGINLPNANWIRKEHGSKSVSLGNIIEAYDDAAGKGSLAEFAHDEEEMARSKEHGKLAGKMHTALHEVVGHASGQINKGVKTPKETLKNYSSTLEEGRADLVALYYILDTKLVDLGLIPSIDVGKAEYDSYIRNGMMLQLRRLELGENIEEDHMRNRQLVASWAFEKGAEEEVISKVERDGKTYFEINDYDKLRELFGQLLKEIQRIKSEGDYESGKALVENYGVKVDAELHEEVLKRYEKLNMAPYSGFVQPRFEAIMQGDDITDIKVYNDEDFATQMLRYAKDYSFLPSVN